MFNPLEHQADFPILQRQVHGKRLVYLDNAATAQKPRPVIQAMVNYYEQHNANVHRGVHTLGDESTKLFHQSRKTVADFFNAEVDELIIVRNTTEASNQVAYTWGESSINEGDVIVATEMEHHSNIVPWQQLAKRKKAQLDFIPVDAEGRLDWVKWLATVTYPANRIKLLALSHVSNTLGTLNPISEIVAAVKAKAPDVKIFIDGAQAAPHLSVDFKNLDVDFYAVSAHKMLGPMGIGALLVKRDVVKNLPPFLFGGGMINEVCLDETSFAEDLEERFTAGTPDVASLVGWAAACDYLKKISMHRLLDHDRELVQYTLDRLSAFPQIKIIGPTDSVSDRVGSVAFMYEGVHAHDLGQVLDSEGVAVRSGHHCTMPLHEKFGWTASTRVSFQLYNTTEDIDVLVEALKKIKTVFGT
jgi:cysteine desulfurase/selenocysteine lyase